MSQHETIEKLEEVNLADFGQDQTPPMPSLSGSLEDLWTLRCMADEELRYNRDVKNRIDAELARRFREAHPDFDESGAGGRQLAGGDLVVTMTYSRDYEVDEREAIILGESELLTATEYRQLVTYEPKVNGTVYNQLAKRGGPLLEALQRVRRLKSARPDFKSAARK